MIIFAVYGFKILCEISKGTFEISHKILNPYTAKYAFYCFQFLRVSYDIFELWRHNTVTCKMSSVSYPCCFNTTREAQSIGCHCGHGETPSNICYH